MPPARTLFWRVETAACCLLLLLASGCSPHRVPAAVPAGLSPVSSSAPAGTTTAGETAPAFADVTEAAGIRYQWQIPGKRPLDILQTIGNGCAFLDYDNDGSLDILLVGPKLALYKGDGKGHFTDVTVKMGLDKLTGHFLGCAVGDYDNDGFADIYISAYRGGVLLHNEAGKRFQDMTASAGIAPQPWGTSCTFADLDGDGKLDLYICNYVAFGPQTQPRLCTFGDLMSSCGPRFYSPERGVLYRNEGNGKFRDVTRERGGGTVSGKGLGVAAADFDASGHLGLAIANDEMPGDLMANQKGRLRNIGGQSGIAYDNNGGIHGGMGIDWGDYDNDGRLDLVVATFQHEAKNLYHNEGSGMFTERSSDVGLAEPASPYVAFGVKFLDYDNDGFLDLVFANGHVQDNIAAIDKTTTYRQSLLLLHNHNGSNFEDVSRLAGKSFGKAIVGRGLAVGDYDNDGRMDMLVVDSEGTPLLLHNETPSVGHWLLCRLVGKKSSRDGIGALVTAEMEGRKLLRRCATDGSYLSASDSRVHFGLGKAVEATLTVQWPDGAKSTYAHLPADRIVTLREP